MTGGTTALTYRPVGENELEVCAGIWRTSINHYIERLGQHPLAGETAQLVRLYTHLRATDPERFIAAVERDRIVGFAAAVVREDLWYLSMCFVLPESQGAGVGRTLLERVGPPDGFRRSTATDSAQPISNALYASLGIVPRVPLFDLIGNLRRPEAFGALPSGITPIAFEAIAGVSGGEGHRRLAAAVDALDRETLGVAHPSDHRFLRTEGRRGWLFHGPDGSPIGYGYASDVGRVGPVAARDADLIAPIVGYVTGQVQPRGAFAMWLPGTADRVVVAALGAGLRMEPFPVLLCWDRPFAALDRYLPISPGLL